jgi:hypothetical protein
MSGFADIDAAEAAAADVHDVPEPLLDLVLNQIAKLRASLRG